MNFIVLRGLKFYFFYIRLCRKQDFQQHFKGNEGAHYGYVTLQNPNTKTVHHMYYITTT